MRERLQKIIARAGVASRRKAEDLIRRGEVTVNGQVVTAVGSQADPDVDHIKVGGKLLRSEPLEYHAVHKPRSVLSSTSDDQGRPVVTDFVRSNRRLYPAGRLDYESEGLMILTNDGDLTGRVIRAGTLEKKYRVKVHGQPDERKLKILRRGLRLGEETFSPCRITPLKLGPNCWFEVTLKQGRNRQIRRMFEEIGHSVMRLRRISIGPVQLGKLPPGASRRLTAQEISALKGEGRPKSGASRRCSTGSHRERTGSDGEDG